MSDSGDVLSALSDMSWLLTPVLVELVPSLLSCIASPCDGTALCRALFACSTATYASNISESAVLEVSEHVGNLG